MAGIRRFGRSDGLHSWGVTMFMFAWGFGSFCFYKIASALAFDEPPNVLSCVVLAVLTTGVIFMLTKAMITRYGKWCADRVVQGRGQDDLLVELVGVTLLAGAVAALAGWLVMIGFDASFSEGLVGTNFMGEYEVGNLIIAMGIFALPTLANGGMGTLALYSGSSQLADVAKPHLPKVTPESPPTDATASRPKGAQSKSTNLNEPVSANAPTTSRRNLEEEIFACMEAIEEYERILSDSSTSPRQFAETERSLILKQRTLKRMIENRT
jgi:hypothetical protein